MSTDSVKELVVLASPAGEAIGTAEKSQVHTTDTPLHFAFSTWLVRGGEVLLTRRALSKQTWPGVWTNAFCGHPGPGEENAAAVMRRAQLELGLESSALLELREVLPDFAYRAVDSSGIVEHEICPVFIAHLAEDATLAPNPDEVDSLAWARVSDLIAAAEATPFAFSPWMVEELAHEKLRAALQ
ncbi:isopentenyl-diphosphate Delta-isomerase [Corynebacterium sp.]|uniref:isopentenyl-diphosphate Delta-isomerase n=1 Tax=Corynebacterium sp. TaxID=1720 RepID=UPI0026DC8BAD|nr:isopentenyl-diphosphate Delta-isomerase [Corynebacterium sp.]MDO5031055.1 isopentenyl-diphosphate Delta-isomerase [Corynebacterium sp.]